MTSVSDTQHQAPFIVLSVLLLPYSADTTLPYDSSWRYDSGCFSFYEQCLKWLLGIRWYDRVGNDEAPQRISLTSLSHLPSRWRTAVRHVDRLDEDTPANKALKSHVTKSTSVSRPPGRTCVVHGTSIARSAPKWFHPSHGTCVLESGGVPSAVDTVVQRRYTALDNDDGNKLCFMGL